MIDFCQVEENTDIQLIWLSLFRHMVLRFVDFAGWGECRHTARRVLEWNPSL